MNICGVKEDAKMAMICGGVDRQPGKLLSNLRSKSREPNASVHQAYASIEVLAVGDSL